jgi:hypothetical protein
MSAMSRGLLRAAASMALRFVDRCLRLVALRFVRQQRSLEERASTPPQQLGKGRGIVFVLGLYYLSRWAKGLWSKSQYGGLAGPDLICRVPEMGFSFFLLFSGRTAKLCSQKKKKRKTFKKIGSKTKKKNKRCH